MSLEPAWVTSAKDPVGCPIEFENVIGQPEEPVYVEPEEIPGSHGG